MPNTHPESEDELPETDPEDDASEPTGSPVQIVTKKQQVLDEDYDSFDDFDATQADPVSSSSSEDSEAGNDTEYVNNTNETQESQETQPKHRAYSLRTRKAQVVTVDLSSDNSDDSFDEPVGKIEQSKQENPPVDEKAKEDAEELPETESEHEDEEEPYDHEGNAPNTSWEYIRSFGATFDNRYRRYLEPRSENFGLYKRSEPAQVIQTKEKPTTSTNKSLDDSFDDPEFVESVIETNVSVKRKRPVLDDGEFLTDKPTVQVDKATRMKWAEMTTPPPEALKALKEFFGHNQFRPKQWDVVRSVLAGKDQFVLMSTGYGKSVCYQLPSLLLNSLTIVISPLISLMNDQVTTLVAKGIDAIKLDGDSGVKDWDRVNNDIHRIRFIYMSPEMATTNKGLDLLASGSEYLTLLAIDEAHCVSQWGHDFRNSYRHLVTIRNRSELCSIPMIALTATATVRVRDDVIQNLKLRNPRITTTSFDRKNLYIAVQPSKEVSSDLEPFLEMDPKKGSHFGGPTIIYCQTKQLVEDVNNELRKLGVRSAHYHAGLTKNQREKAHSEFMKDKITTIVATVAFGMGIDKPDVRHVIHYGCPKDIESYYQEMGRAGRDGAPSVCRVFWAGKDMATNKFKIRNAKLSEEVIENAMLMLKQLELVLNTAGCRRYQLLKHFDPNIVKPAVPQPDCCDRCTDMISKNQDSSSSLLDVAKEARLLFQVIQEMYDGKTGMGKPIEFIRGSSKEEWRMKTMTQKQLFGSGKNLPEKWWRELASALRLAGYIKEVKLMNMKFGNCVSLSSTATTWLINGKELRIDATPILIQGKQEKNKPTAEGGSSDVKILGASKKRDFKWAHEDERLKNVKEGSGGCVDSKKMIELRKCLDDQRLRMATLKDIAPFQIVSNQVLDSFTCLRPTTSEHLELVEGMSAIQKNAYGKPFMACVAQYCKENGVPTNVNMNESIPSDLNDAMNKELTDATKRVYRAHLFIRSDAKAIATECILAESTVFNYLSNAAEKGLPVYVDKLNITRKTVALCLKAAREKIGSNIARLTPWKEALGDLVDFNQLKLIRSMLIYEYGVDEKQEENSPSSSSQPKPAVVMRQFSSQEPAKKKFKL